jgi:hypothetical protein
MMGASAGSREHGLDDVRMLRWKTRQRAAGETYLVLEGDLTEAEAFDGLRLDGERIVLNLQRVRYINSAGSKRFLHFLDELRARAAIEAELCSPAMVKLLNMVPLFARYMQVRSMVVPTECPSCEHASELRLKLPDGGARPEIPRTACEECGTTMQLEEPEERYFAFLAAG